MGHENMKKILIIDNYDSFTYNLTAIVEQKIGADNVVIMKNDEITSIEALKNYQAIIISPGPGSVDIEKDFGVCKEIIEKANIPLLGICLGHQGIGYYYGAKLRKLKEPAHGIYEKIKHCNSGLFAGIRQNINVVRYHSLELYDIPKDVFEICAETESGVIMAIKHKYKPFYGIQFHPESILTTEGKKLIHNFLKEASFDELNCEIPPVERYKTREALAYQKQPLEMSFLKLCEKVYEKNKDIIIRDSCDYSRYSYLMFKEKSGFIGLCEKDGVLYENRDNQLLIADDKIETIVDTHTNKFFDNDIQFEFTGGLFGFFGYEYGNAKKISDTTMYLFKINNFIVYDSYSKEIYIVSTSGQLSTLTKDVESYLSDSNVIADAIKTNGERKKLNFDFYKNRSQYIKDINTCKESLVNGDSYEICLTNKISLKEKISNPFLAFKVLRKNNPSPFMTYLEFDEKIIISCSPERFMKINDNRTVEVSPIKGTTLRDVDEGKNLENKKYLVNSDKEVSENLMIVDLMRNDLNKSCYPGSVSSPRLMYVETFASVNQLISDVRGLIKKGVSNYEVFNNAFPPGSMTGAPKIRSMEILEEIEQINRGIYSGCIGYFSNNGVSDMSVAIRTLVIDKDEISIGCGGAITYKSDNEEEFVEINIKANSIIDSISEYFSYG
jgi:para-aminobenzoate synthetase